MKAAQEITYRFNTYEANKSNKRSTYLNLEYNKYTVKMLNYKKQKLTRIQEVNKNIRFDPVFNTPALSPLCPLAL